MGLGALLCSFAVFAQINPSGLAWLAQEVGGGWQASGGETTRFSYLGAGTFRVQSTDSRQPLATWNGLQVRVEGALSVDSQGWTAFRLNGVACRIGKGKDGTRRLEILFDQPGSSVPLVKAPGT